MGGFIEGLWEKVGPTIEQKLKDEHDLKFAQKMDDFKAWRDYQMRISRAVIQRVDPDTGAPLTKERAEELTASWKRMDEQMQKVLSGNKPLREMFSKVGAVTKRLLVGPKGAGGQPGQAQAGQQPSQAAEGQPGQAQAAAQGAPPSITRTAAEQRLPPPIPPRMEMMGMAQPNPRAEEEIQFQDWLERGRRLGLTGRDLAEYAGTQGQRLPSMFMGTRKNVKFKLPDGTTKDYQQDSRTGTLYDPSDPANPVDLPEGSTLVATSSAMLRNISGGAIPIKDAVEMAKSGTTFPGMDGKPLDLSKVPENMVLQPVGQAGGVLSYVPVHPRDVVTTVGGRVYASSPFERQEIPQGGGVELGPSRTPSTTARETMMYDPQKAEFVPFRLHSTTTPATPGATGRTPSAPSPPGPGAAGSQQGATGSVGGRSTSVMPPGQLNTMLQRVTPVREAHSQIFGDPSQPGFTPLSHYAPLADNAASSAKLGQVLRYTFDQLNEASGGRSGSGFWNWVNAGIWDQEIARVRAQVQQGMLSRLTPEETEAFNATVDAISTAVGLRTLSRASAAQASVRRIEADIPVIGVNVFNAQAFYDKLTRLAEITYNGSVGVPKVLYKPGELDDIKSLPERMKKLRDEAGKKVKMRAPDGTVREVPVGKVDLFKSRGAVVVQ